MKKLVVLFIFVLFLGGVCAVCEEGDIDINNATKEELDNLYGIGPAKADAIINTRPFSSVDELIEVYGIGEITLTKIKEQGLACVSEEPEETQKPPETDEEKEEENNEIPDIIEDDDVQDNQAETSSYSYQTPIPIQPHVIELTKSIKSKNNTEEKDKSVYAKYGFTIFCALLGTLFILKKKKHKKNEFGL